MKKQITDIIRRSNQVIEGYHDMEVSTISDELKLLRHFLDGVEGKLIAIEDEAQEVSDLLDKAIVAVNQVSDAYEAKIGGARI
jgi:hypothetical protein